MKSSALLGALALLSGCTASFLGGGSALRPANVEIQIFSQSNFDAEVTPCG